MEGVGKKVNLQNWTVRLEGGGRADGWQQRLQKQSSSIVDLSEYSCTRHINYIFTFYWRATSLFFQPRINIPSFMVDGELIKF